MKLTSLALAFMSLSIFGHATAAEKALVISHEDENLQWMPCPDFIPKGCEIAVLHGNPAEDNLDIFFKVPGDFEIPAHIHTSQERMVLVSGTLDVIYNGQEKETVQVGEYA